VQLLQTGCLVLVAKRLPFLGRKHAALCLPQRACLYICGWGGEGGGEGWRGGCLVQGDRHAPAGWSAVTAVQQQP
jgi:hypothetical protein